MISIAYRPRAIADQPRSCFALDTQACQTYTLHGRYVFMNNKALYQVKRKTSFIMGARKGGGARRAHGTLELEEDDVVCCAHTNYPETFARAVGVLNTYP